MVVRRGVRRGILKNALNALSIAMEALEDLEFPSSVQTPDIEEGISFYDEVERFEVALIRRALKLSGGNQTVAAALLGLRSQTLNSKIKSFQIRWRDLKDKGSSTAKLNWRKRS